jgi:hypothetical protein
MLLGQLGRFLLTASLLSFGCYACHPKKPPKPPSPATGESDYRVITPDVSSYPPQPAPVEPVTPVGENEDVMASILSIPPGK